MRTSVMSRPFTARNRPHTSIEFIMADENCNFKSYGGCPSRSATSPGVPFRRQNASRLYESASTPSLRWWGSVVLAGHPILSSKETRWSNEERGRVFAGSVQCAIDADPIPGIINGGFGVSRKMLMLYSIWVVSRWLSAISRGTSVRCTLTARTRQVSARIP